MYNTADTIAAISSPTNGIRKILRISGPSAINAITEIAVNPLSLLDKPSVSDNLIIVDPQLKLPCELMIFPSPNSYTGDDLIEIHINANNKVLDCILTQLCVQHCRLAQPGEFTARAYLNGKMGLAQAEAVSEIISAGNDFKLNAAQKLLAGKLSKTVSNLRNELLDTMTLLEAGMDFSEEDIEFISCCDAISRLKAISTGIDNLLTGPVNYESIIDLPTVAIAGVTNAGKSSLLNTLAGCKRSIVSSQAATTRDVLDCKVELENTDCILLDCAGFVEKNETILDELATASAIEAISTATIVIFCIDVAKNDYVQDSAALLNIYKHHQGPIIAAITKCDQVEPDLLAKKLGGLNTLVTGELFFTSSKNGTGIDSLKSHINSVLLEIFSPLSETDDAITINRRHRRTLESAKRNITSAVAELDQSSNETAAMFIRTSYQSLAGIEDETIDEKMLERIFANFCIGK